MRTSDIPKLIVLVRLAGLGLMIWCIRIGFIAIIEGIREHRISMNSIWYNNSVPKFVELGVEIVLALMGMSVGLFMVTRTRPVVRSFMR